MKRSLVYTGVILLVITCSLYLPSSKFEQDTHLTLADIIKSEPASSLTLQDGAQRVLTKELQQGIKQYEASAGAALLLDSHTGAIMAVMGYGGDAKTETFETITQPYEPGSVMKPLLVAAALDSGAITMDYHYYDRDWDQIGDKIIVNSHRYPSSERTLQEVITLSLNTGAVNILREMGGGKVNEEAINVWRTYLTSRYHFGDATTSGIGSDAPGVVPQANMPAATSRFAQSAFGIGITITPLQLAAAYSAISSDGQWHAPCLIKANCQQTTSTQAVNSNIPPHIRSLLINALISNNPTAQSQGFVVGGKSGTAPLALAGATYQADIDNGTYIGFIENSHSHYTLFVRLTNPHVDGYASLAAAQTWGTMVRALVDTGAL